MMDAFWESSQILLIFRKELREKPNDVCCTESEGKELLNQSYLKAIRCKCMLSINKRAHLGVYISFLQITFTTSIIGHKSFSNQPKRNVGGAL